MIAPHNAQSQLGTVIGAHFDATIPNLLIQETCDDTHATWVCEVIRGTCTIEDGSIVVPDGPASILGWTRRRWRPTPTTRRASCGCSSPAGSAAPAPADTLHPASSELLRGADWRSANPDAEKRPNIPPPRQKYPKWDMP